MAQNKEEEEKRLLIKGWFVTKWGVVELDDKLFKGGELSRVKYPVKHISKYVGLDIVLGWMLWKRVGNELQDVKLWMFRQMCYKLYCKTGWKTHCQGWIGMVDAVLIIFSKMFCKNML